MNLIISLPTILICTAISTIIVALALSFVWIFDRREAAIGWWCATMWAVTAGCLISATRTVLPAWFALGIGNAILTLGIGLSWAGCVAFQGKRPSRLLTAAGAVLWIVAFFGFHAFRSDINARIVLLSLIFAVYSVMVVRISLIGWKTERLPSLIAMAAFFGLHALLFISRATATMIWPATEQNGTIYSPWIAAFALEGFTLTIFSGFVFMSLVKERAERRYRLAADSLTSAASRRHFVAETRRILADRPQAAVLAVLDLDLFKKINDTYGHMAGDRALQTFAALVNRRLVPGMIFGRLGGEEFGLFLPETTGEEARAWLGDLRAAIEALDISFNGNSIRITTSIGAAAIEAVGHDFDHLLAGADNALYLAKNGGRNQVRMFEPVMRLHTLLEEGVETRHGNQAHRVSRRSVRSRPGRD
mgnify:CR=1 FL=1